METVTVNINDNIIVLLEKIIENEIYPNKSECIRAATRNLLLFHGKLKINSKSKIKVLITKTYNKELLHDIKNRIKTNNQTDQEYGVIN